jgi:hypothetical protein
VRARLDGQERAVLAHLFVEVYELLDDGSTTDPDPLAALVGIGTSVDLPDDPALARLLPDAHKDDPEASSEFRRYTEQGLRQRKRAALETARLTLGRDGAVLLGESESQAWLTALTDVRLVLAERVGLRTEDDHERLMRLLGISPDDDLDGPDEPAEDDPGGTRVDPGGPRAEPDGGPGAGELLGRAVDESLGVDVEPVPEGNGLSGVPAGDPRGSGSTSGLDESGLDESSLDDGELDDGDVARLATMLSLYDFLTWLQETLVQAVCDD